MRITVPCEFLDFARLSVLAPTLTRRALCSRRGHSVWKYCFVGLLLFYIAMDDCRICLRCSRNCVVHKRLQHVILQGRLFARLRNKQRNKRIWWQKEEQKNDKVKKEGWRKKKKKATGEEELLEQCLFYCQIKLIKYNSLGIFQWSTYFTDSHDSFRDPPVVWLQN